MKFHRTTLQVDLEYLPLNQNGVPQFLPLVIEFIKQNVNCEGLFRINGNKNLIKKINESLSQHIPSIPEDSSPHDVASFLKVWVKDLPVPLINPQIITKFYNSASPTATVDVLQHLSNVSRKCVAMIFNLIREIINNSGVNKMAYENIEICFFYALTQVYKDFPKGFQFKTFFVESCGLLNEDGTDFEFNSNVGVNSLIRPKSRAYRSQMTAVQRRCVGIAAPSTFSLDNNDSSSSLTF